MFRAQDLTIKRKLIIIIMATSFLALMLVGISFVFWSQVIAKNTLKQNLSTQAEMIAENSQAALTFQDADGAKDTLASLNVIPSIVYGAVYDTNKKIFANYAKDEKTTIPQILEYDRSKEYSFSDDSLIVVKNIKLDNEVIGMVVLCSNLSPLRSMLAQNIKIIMSLLVMASLLAYIISSKIQRVISRPILSLANVATMVSASNDYSVRANKESNDEIGLLIDSFNYMLEHIQEEINDRKRAEEEVIKLNETLEQRVILRTAELEKTHKQLMVASRHAGMAEVATDVLHNVGNVLNSVNVLTTLIEEKVKASRVKNVQKVAEMIHSHIENIDSYLKQDEQGKHIPQYLCDASQYMIDDQKDMLEKLSSLATNVSHIKEIISMQQSYAKTAGVSIITTIDELVEDSIQINQAGLLRHGIELIREHEEFGKINVDRQRVVQILVNLIGNAKYAVTKNESDDKKIIICSYLKDDKCVIEVKDNGIGISPDCLTKIFRHGFTTKDNGHGFGLHSGALAAKEMGGSLSVHSDGPNKGACFTLEIPFKSAEIKNGSEHTEKSANISS